MKQIGFITSEDDPSLISDDRLVIAPLKKLGYIVEPVVWDSPMKKSFDALIFRSCWNYHKKHSKFLKFLLELKDLNMPILNSIEVIEWNLNKKHILELEAKILIPKTKFFKSASRINIQTLKDIAQEWNVDKIVVKPAVSLNGHDTFLLGLDAHAVKVISGLLITRDVLVQEFIPEITSSGEISLVYFNKKLSHAIRKIPAKNEFRVHREYGGTRANVTPSLSVLNYGQSILDDLQHHLLYDYMLERILSKPIGDLYSLNSS